MATYKTIKYIVPTEVVEHTDSINALADVDTSTAAPTEGQTIKWNGTNWVPGDIEESASGAQKAIFGFGKISTETYTNITNLVSSSGVVATDTTGVGTARDGLAAASYGGDKALFGFGRYVSNSKTNATNLVSNTGVVASDTTGVGTARQNLAAASYDGDKAIFGFGIAASNTYTNITNLVSNAGVVSTDQTGVGTTRYELAAAGYGGDKAIFGYGYRVSNTEPDHTASTSNLVSNTGVVASDTSIAGTHRYSTAAAGYGGDKAIFGFGYTYSGGGWLNATNLVSNTGVVASDTTGVGTARSQLAAASYGGDKAIFGFGYQGVGSYYNDIYNNETNLVSNTGVVSLDTTGVGTGRHHPAAAGYSSTA